MQHYACCPRSLSSTKSDMGKQAMRGNVGLLVTSAGKPQQKAHLRKTPPHGLNFI